MLILTVAVCFYVLGVHAMQSFEEEMQFVSFIQTSEGGLPIPENTEENQILWSEFTGRTVENRDLFRSADATVLALHGRSDLLFPEAPMLHADSKTSCLISVALANELFGTTDVTGLPVIYQEKQYEIAGIIEHKEPLFVYEPEEGEMSSFQRVVTKAKEQESRRGLEETLQMRYGSGKVLDYTWMKTVLDIYLSVIPLGFSIFFLSTIWKYQKDSKSKREKCVWLFLFVGIGVVVGFLTIRNISIPVDMIPDRWSDFEFWADYADYQRENLARWMQMRKTVFDMRVVEAVRKIVCCNIAAILLFYGNSCYTKKQRTQERI